MKTKRTTALLMAATITILILLSGCSFSGKVSIQELDRFSLWLENGTFTCDFENNTIEYERFMPECNEEMTIPPEKIEEYKEIATTLCQEMLDRKNEFECYPKAHWGGKLNETKIEWSIRFSHDGCFDNQIEVTEWAEKLYPECWDEFIRYTNELTGWDINELVFYPDQP